MGEESYQQALGIVAKVDQELTCLAAPERPNRRGKGLKMPREPVIMNSALNDMK